MSTPDPTSDDVTVIPYIAVAHLFGEHPQATVFHQISPTATAYSVAHITVTRPWPGALDDTDVRRALEEKGWQLIRPLPMEAPPAYYLKFEVAPMGVLG